MGVTNAQHFNYNAAWQEVGKSIENSLPQTAYEQVMVISKQAEKDENPAQYTKALVYITSLKMQFGEEVIQEVDSMFLAALMKQKSPYLEITHAYYALFLNRYLSENNYEISSRTHTADGNSLPLMSQKQLQTLITFHLRAAVSNENLINNAVKDFPEFITGADTEQEILPSVLHVVTQLAMDYYTQLLQTRGGDQSWMPLSSEKFLVTNFQDNDDDAGLVLARYFQMIQKLNQQKEYLTSSAYFELQRIRLFASHYNSNNDKGDLDRLLGDGMKQYRKTPYVTHYYAEAARNIMNKNAKDKYVKAIVQCEKAIQLYPHHTGAILCQQLIEEINQKNLAVVAETTIGEKQPIDLQITTRNITRIFGRLIKQPEYFKIWNYNDDETSLIKKLKTEKVLQDMVLTVEDKRDYNEVISTTSLKAQKLGQYLLIVSNAEDFSGAFSVTPLMVTNLAYVNPNGSKSDFIIMVNRTTGKPVKGVDVQFYTLDYAPNQGSIRREIGRGKSDASGFVAKPAGVNNALGIIASKGKDIFDSYATHYTSNISENRDGFTRNEIFTDRPIYRPGQTVNFKVLSLSYNHLGVPSVRPNTLLEVVLNDANGQKIKNLSLKTNEWGSASGSFTIPNGRLNGYFQIICEESSKSIRVEEYKRPRFEVTLDSLMDSPMLGDVIKRKGKAAFYSGLALQRAQVKFQVKRRELIPYCYRWYPGIFNTSEVIVAQGESKTGEFGEYELEFKAEASNTQAYKPIYLFEIEVVVTAEDGESQTLNESVFIRQEPFIVESIVASQLDKAGEMAATVHVKNTMEVLINKSVNVKIRELSGPAEIMRKPYWNEPSAALPDPAVLPLPEEYRGWKPGKLISSHTFSSFEKFDFSFLEAGVYQFEFQVDNQTPAVEVVVVTDFKRKKLPKVKHVLHAFNKIRFETGETMKLQLGATSGNQMVFVTLLRGSQVLSASWLNVKKNTVFAHQIEDADKGGLNLNYWYIKDNRFYVVEQSIEVPWSDKELTVKWLTFNDKTLPGSKEKIQLQIAGSKVGQLKSEILATLYDASLDALEQEVWNTTYFPSHYAYLYWDTPGFGITYNQYLNGRWNQLPEQPSVNAVTLPKLFEGVNDVFTFMYFNYYRRIGDVAAPAMLDAAPAPKVMLESKAAGVNTEPAKSEKSAEVSLRKNLKELVFFYPHLLTDENGQITIEYTMNEALTSWHLRLFAHNKELASVVAEKEIKTSKDWMVLPNMPRLIRTGDELMLTATVANQLEIAGDAVISLKLKDHLSGKDLQSWISSPVEQNVRIESHQQKSIGWQIKVPEGNATTAEYTISVVAGNKGDAETGILPVITNEVLITEALPLIIRPGEDQKIVFDPLQKAKQNGIMPLKYGVEMTSHPAWYAIQALPYVLDHGYDNAIDISDRLYITAVSEALCLQYPQLESVLQQWASGNDSAQSSLEQMEEWKAITLQETPWVSMSNQERMQMSGLVKIFNKENQQNNWTQWRDKLLDLRLADGSFGWFKGGSYNLYTTARVVIAAGKAHALGIEKGVSEWMRPTIEFLDNQIAELYQRLQKEYKNDATRLANYTPGEEVVLQLYARSFFRNIDVSEASKPAYQFLRDQANLKAGQYNWQVRVWLAMYDFRSKGTAWKGTVASLHELAKSNPAQGMYWNNGNGLRWNEMPLEAHAGIMELMYETGSDQGKLEEMKIWLLTQKKSHHWPSTRGTADAVAALLLYKGPRQVNFTDAEGVKVIAGGFRLPHDNKVKAGTSYFLQSWDQNQITEDLAKLELSNIGNSVAMGAIYFQYLSDVDKVKPSQVGLTSVTKKMYKEQQNGNSIILVPLDNNTLLAPGDVLVSRIAVKLDRDLDFVHIKDMRGSGLEPYDVRSGYKWNGGYGYFENITDAASHYFFDHLPKGEHVVESRQRVVYRGQFSGALVQLECLYAPEFSAHSEGSIIEVK